MKRLVESLLLICVLMVSTTAMAKTNGWGDGSKHSHFGVSRSSAVSSIIPDQVVIGDPLRDDITSPGSPVVDITTVRAGVDGTDLVFEVNFSEDTVMDQVVGLVDVDVDENEKTGGPAHANFWIPDTEQQLGVEYILNLFAFPDTGMIEIVDVFGRPIGSVSGVISGKTLRITIPLSLLGNDDGYVRIGMVLGNLEEPTDAAPNKKYGAIQGVGRVTFSPPTSEIIKNQTFDLVIFLEIAQGRTNLDILFVRVTLDGVDISEGFLPLLRSGSRFDSKGYSYRLPKVNLAFLEPEPGNGVHILAVEVVTKHGIIKGHAEYTIVHVTED